MVLMEVVGTWEEHQVRLKFGVEIHHCLQDLLPVAGEPAHMEIQYPKMLWDEAEHFGRSGDLVPKDALGPSVWDCVLARGEGHIVDVVSFGCPASESSTRAELAIIGVRRENEDRPRLERLHYSDFRVVGR